MEKATSCRKFVVVVAAAIALLGARISSHKQTNEQLGRIKSFDDMLSMYGREITEGKNLGPAIQEARRLSKEPDVIKEFADYYVEILELIEESKDPRIVSMERDRLNGIITSASYQRDGQIEMDYAILRRNILESFVDSSANYLMELVQTSPDMAMTRLKEMMKKGGLVGRDDEKEDEEEEDDELHRMEKHDL